MIVIAIKASAAIASACNPRSLLSSVRISSMDESSLRAQLTKLDACRSSLHASFRFWDWVVVAGVTLELIVLVAEYLDERSAFLRATIRLPEKPKLWLFVVGFLGIAMVAGGITEELRIDSQIEGIETRIRGVNEELFGIVSKEAEEASRKSQLAKDKSDAADAKAGKAQQRAVAALQETARLKSENEKLAEHIDKETAQLNAITPRAVLLRSARPAMENKLRNFSGQMFDMELCGTSPNVDRNQPADSTYFERTDTKRALDELLNLRGTPGGSEWLGRKHGPSVWPKCSWAWKEGLFVYVNPNAPSKTLQAATVLSGELASVLAPQERPILQSSCDPKHSYDDDPEQPCALVIKYPEHVVILIGFMPPAKAVEKQKSSKPTTNP